MSYYIPAKATTIHPERQRNPKLAISNKGRMVADDASTFLLPGEWMGKIVAAYPYALEHLDKRRVEVFGSPSHP